MANGRTATQTLTAWKRLLAATLDHPASNMARIPRLNGPTVTALQVAEIVGIRPRSARQWLTINVGPPDQTRSPNGAKIVTWPLDKVLDAVTTMRGPGNRTNRRGKGPTPTRSTT